MLLDGEKWLKTAPFSYRGAGEGNGDIASTLFSLPRSLPGSPNYDAHCGQVKREAIAENKRGSE